MTIPFDLIPPSGGLNQTVGLTPLALSLFQCLKYKLVAWETLLPVWVQSLIEAFQKDQLTKFSYTDPE